IDRLHLRPNFRRIPPIVKFDPHSGMICHPLADEALRRRIAAMAIDNQDAFEPLLRRGIENVAHDRDVGFHTERDRSRKRAKVRRDSVPKHWKYWNAERFGGFNRKSLG